MRNFILALVFLALPTVAMAQQADVPEASTQLKVEMQETVPANVTAGETEAADVDLAEVKSTRTADAAAPQAGDPTTARWWWLVGAIVVAGVLLAAIL